MAAAKRSTQGPLKSWLARISGAMYPSGCTIKFIPRVPTCVVGELVPFLPILEADPKSANLRLNLESNSTFSGFKSPWVIPIPWRYLRALNMYSGLYPIEVIWNRTYKYPLWIAQFMQWTHTVHLLLHTLKPDKPFHSHLLCVSLIIANVYSIHKWGKELYHIYEVWVTGSL